MMHRDPAELPGIFFEEVRNVHVGNKDHLNFSGEEFAAIAADIALSNEFCRYFDEFSQDKAAKKLVLQIIGKLILAAEDDVARCEDYIKILDVYPARLGVGAAGGATAALLYGAVAAGSVGVLGPALLAAGGMISLSAALVGRIKFARDRRLAHLRSQQLASLLKELEDRID